MQAKKSLVALCSLLCTCCIGGGFTALQTVAPKANAETATVNAESVDVTNEANMIFHSETDTTVEIDLTFGARTHVFPAGTTGATWVNDHADMGDVDLMQYIKIGGKTARWAWIRSSWNRPWFMQPYLTHSLVWTQTRTAI